MHFVGQAAPRRLSRNILFSVLIGKIVARR
jgi:hypothetical protein